MTVSGNAAGAGTRGVQLNQFAGDLAAEELVFEQLSEGAFDLTGVTGDVWIQSNLLDRLGDSDSDAAIRVSQLSGAAVITGNDFEDVRGAALDLANGGSGESTWLIEDNRIYGDEVFFSTTVTGIRASLVGDSRTDLTLVNNRFRWSGRFGNRVPGAGSGRTADSLGDQLGHRPPGCCRRAVDAERLSRGRAFVGHQHLGDALWQRDVPRRRSCGPVESHRAVRRFH